MANAREMNKIYTAYRLWIHVNKETFAHLSLHAKILK